MSCIRKPFNFNLKSIKIILNKILLNKSLNKYLNKKQINLLDEIKQDYEKYINDTMCLYTLYKSIYLIIFKKNPSAFETPPHITLDVIVVINVINRQRIVDRHPVEEIVSNYFEFSYFDTVDQAFYNRAKPLFYTGHWIKYYDNESFKGHSFQEFSTPRSFNRSGNKQYEEMYDDNGKLTGKRIEYYDDGAVRSEETYFDNKLSGKFRSWYPSKYSNQLETEIDYAHGCVSGKYTKYHTNGNKSCEYFCDEKGDRYGVLTEWHLNGRKKCEIDMTRISSSTIKSTRTEWYSNGMLKSCERFLNEVLISGEYPKVDNLKRLR